MNYTNRWHMVLIGFAIGMLVMLFTSHCRGMGGLP